MKKYLLIMTVSLTALVSCNDDETGTIVQNQEFKLVTSSNTTGKVSFTDYLATTPTVKSFTIGSLDTDGVFLDSTTDEITVASRTNNKLEVYSGIAAAITNNLTSLSSTISSSATDFNNPREIAVVGDKVVVTQDQNVANGNTNKLLVYQKTTTGFTLLNTYTVNFKTWGIFADGTTLYAVADLTGDLVVFNNFFANVNGSITPSKRVTIAGLVRTHGIVFSATDDRMILTDVGSATVDSDGGIIVINNFSSTLTATPNLGTIAATSQVRISGTLSKLGNPVDVAYDNVSKRIYVAERLNAGGQVLVFAQPTVNGDATPIEARIEAGVSSVFLLRK